MEIIERFPAINGDGGEIPADLIGATIIRFGTTDKDVESGEFVIEYRPAGGTEIKRLVMLYNSRAIWIEEAVALPIQDERPKSPT